MGYNYIPKYIRQSESKRPKDVITAARWNELFNLLIEQGDYTAEELGKILGYLSTGLEDLSTGLEDLTSDTAVHIADDTIHVTAADKTAWNGKFDKTGGRVTGNVIASGVVGGSNLYADNGNGAVVNFSATGTAEQTEAAVTNEDGDLAPLLVADPFDDAHATSKYYVDRRANEKLDKTGGVIIGNLGVTGDLNIGSTVSVTEENISLLKLIGANGEPVRIRNVDTPFADNDVATKKYVDEHSGGGGDVFLVTITVSVATDGAITVTSASHTHAEILEAIEAGKSVELIMDDGFFESRLPLAKRPKDSVFFNEEIFFAVGTMVAMVDNSNTWAAEGHDYAEKSDLDNLDDRVTELEQHGGGSADTQWNGKTAVFFGDSLTEQNQHYTKGYHSWIKDILGLASYVNNGHGGSDLRGIYNTINASNDTGDLIVVMGGVNDEAQSRTLGQMGDTIASNTTYGAIDGICNLLNSKYPNSRKLFITPHFQTKYPHSGGITSYEISKAIKEVCEKYSVAVYDNFVMSEIRADNLGTFTVDNCHWNNLGHEMVGKNVAKWLLDKFRYVYTGASVAVTGVTLNKNSTTITEGSTETLTATVAPANATNKAVTWATSSAAVATVNNGVVTAVSDGNATITVTTVDGGFTATCAVTVEAGSIVITGISLNKNSTTITEGNTETLTATLSPAGASGTITWTTSDSTKATVANGVVTAVATGSATITASCGGYSATCVVTVEEYIPAEITVDAINNSCDASFADGVLTLSNKRQTYYGVDFTNAKKITATSIPTGNHWVLLKHQNGTYAGIRTNIQNNYGDYYPSISADLTNYGQARRLRSFASDEPFPNVTSSFVVDVLSGSLVLKIDGVEQWTDVDATDFVGVGYSTSQMNTWSGLTLE